jgi:hypothetical protein
LSQEEKRIYVIVAETVQAEHWTGRSISEKQPAGRIAAQVGHAVGKMRAARAHSFKELYTPITTIVLAARNSSELQNMRNVLHLGGVHAYTFFDQNVDYGYDGLGKVNEVLTAICTDPIDPDKRLGLIDHLPLWGW